MPGLFGATDLRAGLPGASPNVVAQRLRELEQSGVLHRRRLPPPAAASVYELTEWGAQLEPVVLALGRWGSRSPGLLHDAPMSADSIALALRTSFRPGLARGFRTALGLRMQEDRYALHVSDDGLGVRRGVPDAPDAVIIADAGVVNDVIWNGRTLDDAVRAGDLSITGDRESVERFVRLFPLPEPVGAEPTGPPAG